MITGPLLVAVKYHEIGFCDGSHELNPFPWVFRGQSFEILDERLLPISDLWIVLDVNLAGIFLDCFARPALIKHQVVERKRVPFVLR